MAEQQAAEVAEKLGLLEDRLHSLVLFVRRVAIENGLNMDNLDETSLDEVAAYLSSLLKNRGPIYEVTSRLVQSKLQGFRRSVSEAV